MSTSAVFEQPVLRPQAQFAAATSPKHKLTLGDLAVGDAFAFREDATRKPTWLALAGLRGDSDPHPQGTPTGESLSNIASGVDVRPWRSSSR